MRYITVLIISFFFFGCSVKHPSAHEFQHAKQQNINELSQALFSLHTSIDRNEALEAAKLSILYPLDLVKEYELTSPPLFHNTLINMNMKQRGFCYHFAQDLAKQLKKARFKTITVRWADHKRGEYWEHNALVLTAKNQPFKQGILLDAWRDSGKLYWNYVNKDTQYHWSENIKKGRYFGTLKQ